MGQFVNKVSVACGVIIAVVFLLMHALVGFIPVGDGAGWDGGVYIQYVELLGQGKPVLDDPYRSIRMSGFLPLILASNLGASKELLILIQASLNAFMLSFGAALLHDSMLRLGVIKKTATLSVAILSCSWMFICMPVFYPILSDHIALAMVCVSVWCWIRSYNWVLYLSCAYFTWLMPGLFLIPLALAAFPYAKNYEVTKGEINYRGVISLFFMLAVPASLFLLKMVYGISLSDISAHAASAKGKTGSVDIILLSTSAMLLSLMVIIWLGCRVVFDFSTWKSLSVSSFLTACGFFIVSAFIMKISFDWNTGFVGPPLLDYLFYQSLAAPFKPLVAHFISFGPVVLLAIGSCVAWARGHAQPIPKGLLIAFLAFIPLLSFGSESRQWIGILPIAVLIFAVSTYSWYTRIWCLVVSAIVIFPVIWLKANVSFAAISGIGFQTFQWQFYYGRQGPWMSLTTYQVGLIAALGFIVVSCLLQMYSNARSRVII